MRVRIWYTSGAVVGRGYFRVGLRPIRRTILWTVWYPQVRDCCGPGGGVLPSVGACLVFCVGGGDGPDPWCGRRGRAAPLDSLGQAEHGQPHEVTFPPRGDWGQGAGQGLVPRLEDAPEGPVWGGGLPYRPGGRGPWGKHGVGPPADALWAGGCRGRHYVVVPALEDCTPDLRRGLVAISRWGGKVVVGGAEVGGAEAGVAVGCGGLFPLFWVVRVGRLVLLRWGASKACGSFVCDVGVGVACQGLAQLHGGDPDVLVSRVLASPPKEEVHDALVEAFPWGDETLDGLNGELRPAPL